MYQKVSTDLNFVEREKNVEKFWKDNQIFEKSMEQRKDGEIYTFYDGPPTANGKPQRAGDGGSPAPVEADEDHS